MRFFFNNRIEKYIEKKYRLIPVAFFVFVFSTSMIIFFPGFSDQEVMFFLTIVMVGFNICLSLFVIQALARVESRQSINNKDY